MVSSNPASKHRKETHRATLNRLIVTAGIAACLLVTVVTLYPVLREYYVAMRTNEQLSVEYQAIVGRNEQIIAKINALNTVEGIENRAREQFGWVRGGERAVNITGLEITDSTTVLPKSVASGDIQVESNGWTDFLDALFMVQTTPQSDWVPDPFIKD